VRELIIGNSIIHENSKAFVIAEIGHNHQGSIEKALELIRAASESGASAVKFQKRSNHKLFVPSLFNEIYNSENAFGKTYGLHREALEFGLKEYKILISESKKLGLEFFATAFDLDSANFLHELNMPVFKIASGDLQNLPLLKHVASFNKPMIISTGGSNFEMIRVAVHEIQKYHNQLAILQCTASYPAKYEQLNLRVISKLQEMFPDNVIGYSGHDNGIAMAIVAFTLGARIIEKHFTLNRSLKGTDHAFSLEPLGLKKMIRDLERTTLAMGDGNKIIYDEEKAPIRKMGKMIVASKDLELGHEISDIDLDFRSPADGLPPSFSNQIIGKKLKRSIKQYSPIQLEDLGE
jgi:N-acetylneuraminate synthase/sialic acid synthase